MKKIFLLWAGILFVYLLFAGKSAFRFHTTQRNFFSLQADSFLKGHIELQQLPKDLTDLSIFKGKAYLYWPPLPAFFALPFVYFFGINFSDVYYTAFWASFAPILLYLVLQKAGKVNLIPKLPEYFMLLLTIFFAFGTVFFYLSVVGSVWFTSQVISVLPLLLSYYFLFKFVETKRPPDFYISLIALCLAFWSRNSTFFSILLHFYIFLKSESAVRNKILMASVFILFVNFLIFGYFNYKRFGNILETGQGLHSANPRWQRDLKNYGFFNLHYWKHNFYYLFINPVNFSSQTYFINPDPEGNGIFTTSPLFLLLPGILSVGLFSKKNRILLVYLLICISCIIFLLSYFGTGWFQFGYRYLLDIIPLLILILAWVISKVPKAIVISFFILSIIINTMGSIWMIWLAPLLNY